MQETRKTFPHPFSKAYWQAAVAELHNTRVLVFAALMIALRVAMKPVSIPIAADLRINSAFLVNAFGAMVFGPVVAALAAAVTDTLGCLLFPTGPYFFPFIFVEIAGSVIFALFLYRTRITANRLILSRFCIDFGVNIVLNTPIMMWYYQVMLGKYYLPFDMLRIAKNLALFPLEALVLLLLFRVMIPPARRAGLPVSEIDNPKINRRSVILIVLLALLSVGAVAEYTVYQYDNTSRSASYTEAERLERNEAMNAIVLSRHPEWSEETTVTIVESATGTYFGKTLTYAVRVYEIAEGTDADTAAALRGLSKSKAAASPALTPRITAEIVQDRQTGEVTEYRENE